MNEELRPLLTIPLGLGPAAMPTLKMIADRIRLVVPVVLGDNKSLGLRVQDAVDWPLGIVDEDFVLFVPQSPQLQLELSPPVGRKSSIVKDRADEREMRDAQIASIVARNSELVGEVAEIINHSENAELELAKLRRENHIALRPILRYLARKQARLELVTVAGEVSFNHPIVRKRFLAGIALVELEAVYWHPVGMKLTCVVLNVESERHHRTPSVGSLVHVPISEKDAWILVAAAGARMGNLPIKLVLAACVSTCTLETVGYEIADAEPLRATARIVRQLLADI